MKLTAAQKREIRKERNEEKRKKAHEDKMWNRAITKEKMKNEKLTEIKRKGK